MSSAWMKLNEGGNYAEYKKLAEEFDGWTEDEVMDKIMHEQEKGADKKEQMKTLRAFDKFKELNTWAKYVIAYEKNYNHVMKERNDYHDKYRFYEKAMEDLHNEEKFLAGQIGFDHEDACW